MNGTPPQHRHRQRAAWVAIIVSALALLLFGTVRDTGPLTQQDRIDAVTKRIACPTCDGESVYVSRASAAESIRAEVARQVGDGVRTDDEIVAYVAERFGGQVLLVPRATGLDALVWILPPLVTSALLGALWLAFRRWRAPSVATTTRRPLLVALALVVVVGVGGGVLVARQSGQRLPLQTLTGGIEDSTASLLAQARLASGTDVASAIELYDRVLATDPDNVEAITYRAWLVMLSARQFDEDLQRQAYGASVAAFGRALELEPSYADALCFLGIVVFRDGGDAESSREFLTRCLAGAPPAEVKGLVESLLVEVEAALD
ncbi:MAG: cytochrome c biosis protein CcmH [Actinomycetota bacterium]